MDLWKGKHESGQWLEIEAAEAVASKSEFSTINASGIMLSSMANKHNEMQTELASRSTEKVGVETSAGMCSSHKVSLLIEAISLSLSLFFFSFFFSLVLLILQRILLNYLFHHPPFHIGSSKIFLFASIIH